jgi:hypothetical protein
MPARSAWLRHGKAPLDETALNSAASAGIADRAANVIEGN